jgi:hypothetical protein
MLDLKAIIGFFFFIIGILLMLYKFFSVSTEMSDINLFAGLFYMVFGISLLLIWSLGRRKNAK